MRTAIINVKTDTKIKTQAQKVASQLGFSLSALVNAYLRDLIRVKSVHFSLSEEPSEYLLRILAESEADRRSGRVVSFKTPRKVLKYLDKLISDEQETTKN